MASLIKDKQSGRLKAFVFVEMSDRVKARSAIAALNGAAYKGKRTTVTKLGVTLNNGETGIGMVLEEYVEKGIINESEMVRDNGLSEREGPICLHKHKS